MQCSTVGVEGADRTVAAARELDLVLVDCPVLGTREPAAKGALTLLASGPEARERLAPVFDALGSKTLWLGEAGAGSRLELACDSWLFVLTAGTAQAIALARALGQDPQHSLDAMEGGPVDSACAHLEGGLMTAGSSPPAGSRTRARWTWPR
ncbi:NAD(P)-binding domain-containing protein [Geodermatophilus sp. SYSU D01180]